MIKKHTLSPRQELILDFLEKSNLPVSASAINQNLKSRGETVTRMTVNRAMLSLIDSGFVERIGGGRGAKFQLTATFQAQKPVDVEAYFKIEQDKRGIKERFNFNVFSLLRSLYTSSEVKQLEQWNKIYQEHIKKLSPAVLKREYERLTVDLSWKSSYIEGNTYTLLETEHLLREQIEPKGHTKEETNMVINHKTALDYIRARANQWTNITVRKIEEIHTLLVANLGVTRNIRNGLVRIGGTSYRPLDNKFQIREALEKMCHTINQQTTPFAKAMLAMLCIAYIQPFEDGNKRASRLVGNALLIAHHACPLSFRSIDELEYKKAILLFYEQNNFSYFKQLFMEQFEFAVKNYFG